MSRFTLTESQRDWVHFGAKKEYKVDKCMMLFGRFTLYDMDMKEESVSMDHSDEYITMVVKEKFLFKDHMPMLKITPLKKFYCEKYFYISEFQARSAEGNHGFQERIFFSLFIRVYNYITSFFRSK